jgi:hypothetical protein
VLKETARRTKLEAERHKDLAGRQRAARSARSYSDELGMVNIHLALEPHVGTPIVARAEAEAARLGRAARANDSAEPFERLWPTLTPRCCPGPARAGPSAPS